MARKNRDEKTGKEPALKVVGAPENGEAPAPPAPPVPEAIFHDKRSGRDRREDEGNVEDSRRQATAERRTSKMKGAWWLARDYVESHHFVQKSSSSRRRREDKSSDD